MLFKIVLPEFKHKAGLDEEFRSCIMHIHIYMHGAGNWKITSLLYDIQNWLKI